MIYVCLSMCIKDISICFKVLWRKFIMGRRYGSRFGYGSYGHGYSRHQRSPISIELDSAPTSDHFRYVLKWSFTSNDYQCNDYQQIYSGNRITLNHIEQLIAELRINPCYSLSLCSRQGMTKLGIGAGIVCAFFILFIILTSVVPGIAAITSVLIVILICAGFIGLICFFVNANNRHNRRRQELTNQMAGIKNNVFNPLGARIELSTHGSYISIWFD